ncbi:MAG: glycosyltransferase family 4 protein [Actinomycetota bacterium]|nr:glycosyltransferase family 4 protein [Actinomycetota bacterium]
MPRCTIVSFRFGPTDGVSLVARMWADALAEMGFDVDWVAGEVGPGWDDLRPVCLVPGLGLDVGPDDDPEPGPDPRQVADALAEADLVVVENLCTIPLNLPAARAVADALRGRPAILHHHDPPWQRERFAHVTELPPDDPAWRHVTINDLTRCQMADRGIVATTIHNGFRTEVTPGDRQRTRAALGLGDDDRLVIHPVRAIPRKAVDRALALAEGLDATYWLPGPAEDGYGPELARLLAAARCPVVRHRAPSRADLYAAADLVAFPSTWEGFGNPPIEAALSLRPVAVGPYPVANELRALGFRWFDTDDLAGIAGWLDRDANERDRWLAEERQVAVENLSFERMAARLESLLSEAGWMP